MYARWIRCGLARSNHREGPGFVGSQGVSSWCAVVKILVMDCRSDDRDRAFLAELEVQVRCKSIGLEVIGMRFCAAVVGSCAGASDTYPAGIDVYSLTKVNRNRGIVRNVHVIDTGIRT